MHKTISINLYSGLKKRLLTGCWLVNLSIVFSNVVFLQHNLQKKAVGGNWFIPLQEPVPKNAPGSQN